MPPTEPKGRKLKDWLDGLQFYVEETEAPREWWMWGGIFTLCSALQRRVWLPYGIENVYPNLYVMLVGPPGTRKAGPIKLAKRLLLDLGLNVSVDSSSKRALTKELAEISKVCFFEHNGKSRAQCPMAIISPELSSLLAVDPKGMIEALTDLFDSPDKWQHETSGEGKDYLHGVCLGCFLATTPTWLAANLPQEAIGGGYTSRHVIVADSGIYKPVAIPDEMNPRLYKALRSDLNRVAMLSGEFTWGEGSREFFTTWYDKARLDRFKEIKDERIHGFLSRIHIHALKTAMALRVSYSDTLVLEPDDLDKAITILDQTLEGLGRALGGHGRSASAADVEKILGQIKMNGSMSFTELLRINYHDTDKGELDKVMDTITALRYVEKSFDEAGKAIFKWIWKGDS